MKHVLGVLYGRKLQAIGQTDFTNRLSKVTHLWYIITQQAQIQLIREQTSQKVNPCNAKWYMWVCLNLVFSTFGE